MLILYRYLLFFLIVKPPYFTYLSMKLYQQMHSLHILCARYFRRYWRVTGEQCSSHPTLRKEGRKEGNRSFDDNHKVRWRLCWEEIIRYGGTCLRTQPWPLVFWKSCLVVIFCLRWLEGWRWVDLLKSGSRGATHVKVLRQERAWLTEGISVRPGVRFWKRDKVRHEMQRWAQIQTFVF